MSWLEWLSDENIITILDKEQLQNRELRTEIANINERNMRQEETSNKLKTEIFEMKARNERKEHIHNQLQSDFSEMRVRNVRQEHIYNQLQSELSSMEERLKNIETDFRKSSCPCREVVNTQSSISSIIQDGLYREKVSRHTLENAVERLKSFQQEYKFKWITLDNRVKDVQTNVSNILPVCEEKCEVGRIELETLEKQVRTLQTNMTNVLSLCEKRDEVDKDEREEKMGIPEKNACPAEFTKLKTGCYYIKLNVAQNRFNAGAECKRRKSSLVTIETIAETDEIAQYIRRNHYGHVFLTSGMRISGEWKWIEDNNHQMSWIIGYRVLLHEKLDKTVCFSPVELNGTIIIAPTHFDSSVKYKIYACSII